MPPVLTGDPHGRGLALARLGAAQAAAVGARAAAGTAAMAAARAEDWVRQQWVAQQRLLPEVAGLVEGLAEGFGLPVLSLFAGHVRYAVEDRGARPAIEEEGCTAFAVTRADGSALLAKNRDNPPEMRPLQLLLRQRDPAWGGREILCVGSFGITPSASSGMNSDGFCMVDTAVRTRDLGIGALRYCLMEALLIRCGSVAEALALIAALPHVGGGTLVMADAQGEIAAVELGHSAQHVLRPSAAGWLARTNHFEGAAMAPHLAEPSGSAPRANSAARLGWVGARLHAGLDLAGAQALLAAHGDAGEGALCRHDAASATLSGAVYEPRLRRLHLSRGNPCQGDWQTVTIS
jgi:hypothetical protein